MPRTTQPKAQQYVLLPARGTRAAAGPERAVLLALARPGPWTLHEPGGAVPAAAHPHVARLEVLDSLHEDGPKLVAMSAQAAADLRVQSPGLRIVPLTWFRTAEVRLTVERRPARPHAAGVRAGLTWKVVAAGSGAPLAGVAVEAFTDLERREGVSGVSDRKGELRLPGLGGGRAFERVHLYPRLGYWPGLRQRVRAVSGQVLALRPIDLGAPGPLEHHYPSPAPDDAGRPVVVGVIDTGVGPHPDLRVAGGLNAVRGEAPEDFGDNGDAHGTHVAGILAGRGAPGVGLRGLAPGVTLRSYRVFGKGAASASSFAIAKAIDRAVADGCHLLNLSLGGGPADELIRSALLGAHEAGVVTLAATGNEYRQPVSFPAASPLALAVSAMGRVGTYPRDSVSAAARARPYGKDPSEYLAAFSNVGPEVDLTAPGVGLVSSVPGGYAVMDGTSMACPAATARAARLLAEHPEVLAMPPDEARAGAIARLVLAHARVRGFGLEYEGQGML